MTFPTGLPALFVKSNLSGFGKALPTTSGSTATDFATLLGDLETANAGTALTIRPQPPAVVTKKQESPFTTESPKPADDDTSFSQLPVKEEPEPQETTSQIPNALPVTPAAPPKADALPIAFNLPAASNTITRDDESDSNLNTWLDAPAETVETEQPPVSTAAVTTPLPQLAARPNSGSDQALIVPTPSLASPSLANPILPSRTELAAPTNRLVIVDQKQSQRTHEPSVRSSAVQPKSAPVAETAVKPIVRAKVTQTEKAPAQTEVAQTATASLEPDVALPADSSEPLAEPEASLIVPTFNASPQIEMSNTSVAPVNAETFRTPTKPAVTEAPHSKENRRRIQTTQAPNLSTATATVSLNENPVPAATALPQPEPTSQQPDLTSSDHATDTSLVEPTPTTPTAAAFAIPLTTTLPTPAPLQILPQDRQEAVQLEARPPKRAFDTTRKEAEVPDQPTPTQQHIPASLPLFTTIAAPILPESNSLPQPRVQPKTNAVNSPQTGSAQPLPILGTKPTAATPPSPIAFEAKLTPVETKNPDQPRAQPPSSAVPQATTQFQAGPVTQKDADAPQPDAKHPDKIVTQDVKTVHETESPVSANQPHLTHTAETSVKVVNEAAVPVSTPHTTGASSHTPAQEKAAPATVPSSDIDELPALKTEPARDISFRVASNDSNAVEVTLVDRAGQIHVNVRSADPSLTQSLQSNVAELAGKLEQSGFRTETSIPNHTGNGSDPQQSSASQNTQQQQQEQQQRRAPQQNFEQQKKRNANTEIFTLTPDQENA